MASKQSSDLSAEPASVEKSQGEETGTEMAKLIQEETAHLDQIRAVIRAETLRLGLIQAEIKAEELRLEQLKAMVAEGRLMPKGIEQQRQDLEEEVCRGSYHFVCLPAAFVGYPFELNLNTTTQRTQSAGRWKLRNVQTECTSVKNMHTYNLLTSIL